MALTITKSSQFLRELHFIEAGARPARWLAASWSQFLRELHFIEASCVRLRRPMVLSQFLRELHFIEAGGDRYAYCGY